MVSTPCAGRALLHQAVIEQPSTTIYQDNLGNACGFLAYELQKLGQHREANEALQEARTMFQRLVQSNSENARFKESLREIEMMLAECEKALKAAVPGSTAISERPAGTSAAPR